MSDRLSVLADILLVIEILSRFHVGASLVSCCGVPDKRVGGPLTTDLLAKELWSRAALLCKHSQCTQNTAALWWTVRSGLRARNLHGQGKQLVNQSSWSNHKRHTYSVALHHYDITLRHTMAVPYLSHHITPDHRTEASNTHAVQSS